VRANERLANRLIEIDPDRAARQLEGLATDRAVDALTRLPRASAARVLARMAPRPGAGCMAELPPDVRRPVIEAMALDALVPLLRALPAERRPAILDALSASRSAALRRVLTYPAGTAGAWMTLRPLSVPVSATLGDARRRAFEEGARLREYVYVVDDEQRLVGVMSLRALWIRPEHEEVRAMMTTPVSRLPARATVDAILAHPGWQTWSILPVVDADGVLVGILPPSTLRRIRHERGALRDPASASLGLVVAELYFDASRAALDTVLGWIGGPAPTRRRP